MTDSDFPNGNLSDWRINENGHLEITLTDEGKELLANFVHKSEIENTHPEYYGHEFIQALYEDSYHYEHFPVVDPVIAGFLIDENELVFTDDLVTDDNGDYSYIGKIYFNDHAFVITGYLYPFKQYGKIQFYLHQ